MADLQSMTLQERMITIINAEHSLSYGINDLTFQEACNKWLIETGTVNGIDYSGISINKYSPNEALSIIRHKLDLRSENLTELIHELGPYYPIHRYTVTEALNKKNAMLVPYSLLFDGINDEVVVADDSKLDFGTGDFSIFLWVKTTTANGVLVTKGATPNKWEFGVFTGGKLAAYRRDASGNSGWLLSNTAVNDNAWHQVGIIITGTSFDFYIDGVLDVQRTFSVPGTMDNSEDLYIAKSAGLSVFGGQIDEVSIFNKALTQIEISKLYAADPQNAGDAVGISNLAGYWKFDEGTGHPQDTSENGNHGVLDGATWTVH